jgi:tRNA-2-methylthio-N6-dimethylallyladenosine synthase
MPDHTKYYYIITYGCQMNVHDSEMLAGMLEEMGYHQADKMEDADIIILNTCIVRKNAELKVFGKVGSLKPLKRKNPDLIIAVGGCMMQSREAVQELYQKYPQVDLIFGTHNIHHLPELIKKVKKDKGRVVEVWDQEVGLIPDLPIKREDDHKAWVTIIQGCNNFCSYCIVPYTRGRERSRPFEDIVKEVEDLVGKGVKEITLLGQNVNSYGQDLENKYDFADLLIRLDQISGLYRIRYMTSHPRDFPRRLIDVVKNSSSICEHFHLPIQSGSNRILKLMNRGYSREEYLELVSNIREAIPAPSITTDLIVGFPGEGEDDFEETLNIVKEIEFDLAFTFIYSPRTGTPAARMKEQVPEEVKKERLQRLMELQNGISLKKNQQLTGKTLEVLIDGASKNNPEMYSGRDRTNKLIIFPRKDHKKGDLVRIRIESAHSFTLTGRIVE